MIAVDAESFFVIVTIAALAAVAVAAVPRRFAPPVVVVELLLGIIAALAFFSATKLPLVVAITTLAVDGGHMKASTAAGLVGAAMLSTLIFPFAGLALRKRSEAEQGGEPPAADHGEAPAIA